MDLYFEVAGDQGATKDDAPHGAFVTAWLDAGGGAEKSALLLAMASGIDGHAGAHEGADLVVSAFQRGVVKNRGQASPADVLRARAVGANRVLAEAIQRAPALEGVACTLVGATLSQGLLHWVSVGDSHLYLLREGQLRKLNEDHRYGAFLARARDEGNEIQPEPGITPDMLMSAMTGEPIGEIDCPEQGLALRGGDRLLLASQAVETVGDACIVDVLNRCAKPGQGVTALLRATQTFAGDDPDGVMVVVVDVHDRDAEIASAITAEMATADSAPARTSEAAAGARELDVVLTLVTVVLFLATAMGTWYGLGLLESIRRPTHAMPRVPPAVAVAPTPVPAAGTEGGAGPGLTFGSPPPPGLPPTEQGGIPASTGNSLTFGAPAPPSDVADTREAPAAEMPVAATPQAPPGQMSVAEGFRDPLESGGEGPVMVRLPAGRFEMGSRAGLVRAEERPAHRVSVAAFALGAFEVTVAQYARFARDTGRRMPDVDAGDPAATPVSKVSWDDAYDYARWLSRQTGQRYRLPSEAEWEYAASGRVPGPYWWGQQAGENRAHCLDCLTSLDPSRPAQVGRFAANPFGLHDTAGNVAEWVHDCWHTSYLGAPDDARVWEGGDCSMRVVRGGSFRSPSAFIRVQARAYAPSSQALDVGGFRVARDL